MFENRSLRVDLLAIALLAAAVFLGLALASYNPADPTPALIAPFNQLYSPDLAVYPQLAEPSNICGRWGALAADMLFSSIGLGAYYLVASIALLDYFLLRRRDIDSHITRSVGWIVSLVGFVAFIGLVAPAWSPGPVVGSGGYLGALASGIIRQHFAIAGGVILCISMIIGGLMLCTDYALLHIASAVVGVAWLGLERSRNKVRQRMLGAGEGDEYEDEEYEENEVEEEETPLNIRIRGRNMDADGGWEETSEEAAEDDLDEAAAAEEVEEEVETLNESEYEEEVDDEYEEELEDEPEEQVEVLLPVKQSGDRRRVESAHTATRKPAASDRDRVIEELDEASMEEVGEYDLPELDLLTVGDDYDYDAQAKEVRRKARVLEKTFLNFGFNVKVVEIETGPVIAQFEVELEAGLRLSKITGLADDLAIALRVPSVRIVAPIPGKNTVGIEVPNNERQVVRLREVIEEANGKAAKMRIPIYLGKDVSGNPLVVDLTTMPHLLIAGRTGTGKSVCLNAIISSMLMTRRPDEVRMLMIDPKMVELSGYGRLPHLMHPVVTDMKKAEAILAWAVEKMEERYQLLAKAGVRHISSYNQLSEEEIYERLQPQDEAEKCGIPSHLPFIVIVADEIADMMMTAGKEVEQHIIRLAQKSRAVGIHLILATQKPTVDVITGLIKSNLPARISFQVASRTDSRVVLDEMGADKLLGNGDMLFLWPGTSTLVRGQGTYLSDEEIDGVVNTVSTGEQNFVNELVNLKVDEEGEGDEAGDVGDFRKRDELYEKAIDVVVRERRGSLSLLQRALGIGYGRAARLVDFMAEDGIVGPYAGSQAREVVMTMEDWERIKAGGDPAEKASPAADEPPPATISAKKTRRTKTMSKNRDPSKAERPKRRRANVVRPSPSPHAPWEDEDEDSATATLNVLDADEVEETEDLSPKVASAYDAGPDDEPMAEYEDADLDDEESEDAEYESDDGETEEVEYETDDDETEYEDEECEEEEYEDEADESEAEAAEGEEYEYEDDEEYEEYEEAEADEETEVEEEELSADGEAAESEEEYEEEEYEEGEYEDEEYDEEEYEYEDEADESDEAAADESDPGEGRYEAESA